MDLENFREEDIGTTSAWVPSLGNSQESMSHLTYLHFSGLAFYSSAQQIELLEHSNDGINQGSSVQSAIGLWFIAIEAYINSILRISCLVRKESFDELKTKDFGARLKALFEILGIDKKLFYSGPFQRLEEFKCYRNELFHDRTNDKPLEFHKTLFSGNPMYANQVDVMQACVIALETFNAFRNVIPRIDLMPQVVVMKDDSFFYAKLDHLYNVVLRPYFLESLAKHSLTSSVNLEVKSTPVEESPTFLNIAVEVLIKSQPRITHEVAVSKHPTKIGKDLLDRVRNEVSFDTSSHFQLAGFYR